MSARIAAIAGSRPRLLIVPGVIGLVLAALLAAGAPGRIGIGTLALDAPDRPDLLVSISGDQAVGSRVEAVAIGVINAQLRSDPQVSGVRRAGRSGGGPVVLEVRLADDSPSARLAALSRIERAIDPGPLSVVVTGEERVLQRARQSLGGDLWRLELVAAPLIALIAVWILGPALGAAAIAAGLLGALAPAAALRLLSGPIDVSLLGAATAPVGVALGVELTALLGSRYGQSSPATDAATAVRMTLEEWRGPAGLACAAAALHPAALLLTPLQQAESLVIGCAAAALAALTGALCFGIAALAGRSAADARGRRGPARVAGALAGRRRRTSITVLAVVVPIGALGVAGLGARSAGLAAAGTGESLFTSLPAASIAAAIGALTFAWLTGRSPRLVPAGLFALAGALAGTGAGVLVFQHGALDGIDKLAGRGSVETGALACGLAALVSIGGARVVLTLRLAGEWRRLARDASACAAETAAELIPGALLASASIALTCGVLIGADLVSAREFGLIVAVGAIAQLLATGAAICAAARLAPRG